MTEIPMKSLKERVKAKEIKAKDAIELLRTKAEKTGTTGQLLQSKTYMWLKKRR